MAHTPESYSVDPNNGSEHLLEEQLRTQLPEAVGIPMLQVTDFSLPEGDSNRYTAILLTPEEMQDLEANPKLYGVFNCSEQPGINGFSLASKDVWHAVRLARAKQGARAATEAEAAELAYRSWLMVMQAELSPTDPSAPTFFAA